MPWANGIFSPLNNALAKNIRVHKLATNKPLTIALHDCNILVNLVGKEPTPLVQLIPKNPDILGKVDASKHGAGGIWWSATNNFPPLVWQYEFPKELQTNLEVQIKGNTNATNLDYKALGFVTAVLILEEYVNVRHKHITLYCNNTSTVSWVQKLLSKSKQAA